MAVPQDKMTSPAYDSGPYDPPPYEGTTTSSTTQQTYQPHPPITFNPAHLRTKDGILKIVEIVVSLLTFICACAWGYRGSGWVQFVSINAFILTLVLLILICLQVIYRIPGHQLLIEFIYYCIFTVFYLIAALVAIGFAANYAHSSIGATAFFASVATPIYAVDTYFQFRFWRTGVTAWGDTPICATTTTTMQSTTTTTTTTMEGGRPAVY